MSSSINHCRPISRTWKINSHDDPLALRKWLRRFQKKKKHKTLICGFIGIESNNNNNNGIFIKFYTTLEVEATKALEAIKTYTQDRMHSCWGYDEREHLIRRNIIKGKFHSSISARKSINWLVNARKSFSIKAMNEVFCSHLYQVLNIFHVLRAVFLRPKSVFSFLVDFFSMRTRKMWKFAKIWKIQLKLTQTIVASMILGKKMMWISPDEGGGGRGTKGVMYCDCKGRTIAASQLQSTPNKCLVAIKFDFPISRRFNLSSLIKMFSLKLFSFRSNFHSA